MEKILKTIDALKMPSLSNSDANIPGTITSAVVAASDSIKTKKKERINHCRAVTDAVCTSSVQGLTDYHKILESVVEVLFLLCNDTDSDIRLVASDCLNRIARTLEDAYQLRFHMEVYKEIRRAQSPRSLRTAFNLFAFVCPMIRPTKSRAFIASLLPCFTQVSKRTEELLYENLATSFTEIFKHLGSFAHDSEIKILCKDFILNLESSSAIIRRASATILVSICRYSRKSSIFLPKLLSRTTELLLPNLMEKSVSVIIGALLSIRQCISFLYQEIFSANIDQASIISNLLQVYEMCMILCNHDDHNVITTSLETLQQLFTNPPEQLVIKLTSPTGITNSLDSVAWISHPSQNLLQPSSLDRLSFCDEAATLLEADLEVPKFRSIISSTASDVTTRDSEGLDSDSNITPLRRASDVFLFEGTASDPELDIGSLDELQHSDDEKGVKSSGTLVFQSLPEVQIGSLYEENVPIYYCARFISYNFLLTGQKGKIKSDAEVRISAKVLASNCLVNLIAMKAEVFHLTLSHILVDAGSEEEQQKIEDVCLYASHSDHLLRGSVYILAGTIIKSIIVGSDTESNVSILEDLVTLLQQGLVDTSNIGIKCAISGLKNCLQNLLNSSHGVDIGRSLFQCVLETSVNPYWLVKVDLLELLSSLDWYSFENANFVRDEVLFLLLNFLSDEDARVRSTACTTLVKFMKKYARKDYISGQILPFCKQCVANELDSKWDEDNGCVQCDRPCEVGTKTVLELVVNKLTSNLVELEDRFAVAGHYQTLAAIAETFQPQIYQCQWSCKQNIEDVNKLLVVSVDILRSSPLVHDLSVHQSVLSLAGRLFCATTFYEYGSGKEKSVEDSNPFRCCNSNVAAYGVQLLQHCLAVIKLYQNVIESNSTYSVLKKQANSPVISPVKKFSQKIEADKKSHESECDKKIKGSSFSDTICPNHFKKISESLLQTWKVYKSNLEPGATVKFNSLLITAVNTFRRLFACIRSDYSSMTLLMDEVLAGFSAVFYICPIPIIKSIRKVLICIFAIFDPDLSKTRNPVHSTSNTDSIEEFASFAVNIEISAGESPPKPSSKVISDKSSLGNFIRQFESVVVTALKIYTTRSDVNIQAEVLRLLSQLIMGHVNYGLIDSCQVFLNFLSKQIVDLEEGQLRKPNILIQEVFRFLTLLTYKHNSAKKFIEIPEVLQLCEGLQATKENTIANFSSLAIPALKMIIYDIFIHRGTSQQTNVEKKEIENFRETVVAMVLKLAIFPEMIPVIWTLLKGRKVNNELKWAEDSKTILSLLLSKISTGELKIVTKSQFDCLVALLYSANRSAFPAVENISYMISEAITKQINDVESLKRWCVMVNCHWIMLLRIVSEDVEFQETGDLTDRFVLDFMDQLLSGTELLLGTIVHDSEFVVSQIGVSFKVMTSILTSEKLENIKNCLRSDENTCKWLKLSKTCISLSIIHPVFRIWMIEHLASLMYPRVSVWEELLKSSKLFPANVITACILKIVRYLNTGDVPTLEEWIIVNHSNSILEHSSNEDVSLFMNRLSTYRLEQILDHITTVLGSDLSMLRIKDILNYLEKVAETFLCETAVIGIRVLEKSAYPSLSLEISQFCCYALSHIRTRKMQFSNRDREIIRAVLSKPSITTMYPRLIVLACKVLAEELAFFTKGQGEAFSPVLQWCSEETNDIEGPALAEMLSCLTYTQVTAVLAKPDFNVVLLQHAFRNLRKLFLQGTMTAGDVMDLLTSQKRSGLIEKWPLAVAAVEFIVETLDTWENIITDPAIALDEEMGKVLLQNPAFNGSLNSMCSVLTEMLRLKNAVIGIIESDDKECRNNFIPTKIFTLSFQLMVTKFTSATCGIPLEDLRVFFRFAAVAVRDEDFLSFFDVRDNPFHIFSCVLSLGRTIRKLVSSLGINFSSSQSGDSELNSDMNDDCILVLNEFYYIMEFLHQAQRQKYCIDHRLLKSLKDVVAGLGRCELVNGWLLISHLGWRPQILSKSQIFPPIQQIPLEILRNEGDMLLQYISKLSLLGVASKIQFEENWVIFLSVINLYVDESFQLQIVTMGLRALSMMLVQSLQIKYSPTNKPEMMRKAALKIDLTLRDVEPEYCREIKFPALISESKRELLNEHGIDINSCIRFLTDLYSQWLQNPQGKMPLYLLSEVIQSIIVMSEYFDDVVQYTWMYDTLLEIFKSFEKEDEIIWPHLIYGIFYSAAKLSLEGEALTYLAQLLEGTFNSPHANITNASVKSAVVFLQSNPGNLTIINSVVSAVLKCTQLDETSNDSESHCLQVWTLLLFIWIHGPSEIPAFPDFEQEAVRNVLTVLSPLNKVFISVRLLVIEGLRQKVEICDLKPEIKKTITKVAMETLRTPNISIFFLGLKLFLTIYYSDFGEYIDAMELDPEVLMPMAERSEVLFQLLKSSVKCNNLIVSKILPIIIHDFLPPSEILNRVIAEFMSPNQTSPELLAPVVAQVFEKARRRPREAALVREWILASLPNFLANSDVSRTIWSLTLFFVGVSSNPEVSYLLPFAELRRQSNQIRDLFIHSALDFYSTLDGVKKEEFKTLLGSGPTQSDSKKPYGFLLCLFEKQDSEQEQWAIDRVSMN